MWPYTRRATTEEQTSTERCLTRSGPRRFAKHAHSDHFRRRVPPILGATASSTLPSPACRGVCGRHFLSALAELGPMGPQCTMYQRRVDSACEPRCRAFINLRSSPGAPEPSRAKKNYVRKVRQGARRPKRELRTAPSQFVSVALRHGALSLSYAGTSMMQA